MTYMEQEGHCIHFPDFDPGTVRCATCLHGPAVKPREVKPTDWLGISASATPADPGDVVLEALLAGLLCPSCMTSREGLGCSCNRNETGGGDFDVTNAWLLRTQEALAFRPRQAQGFALSTARRIMRRMDLTPEETEDMRRMVREAFEVESKWFQPRVTEPTHLPV